MNIYTYISILLYTYICVCIYKYIYSYICMYIKEYRPGVVAHTYNPSTLGGQSQVFDTSLTNMEKPCLY